MRNVRRYCLVRLQFPCAHWARSVDWQLLEIGTDLRGDEERGTTIPILRDSNLLQTGCELDITQRAPKKCQCDKIILDNQLIHILQSILLAEPVWISKFLKVVLTIPIV